MSATYTMEEARNMAAEIKAMISNAGGPLELEEALDDFSKKFMDRFCPTREEEVIDLVSEIQAAATAKKQSFIHS